MAWWVVKRDGRKEVLLRKLKPADCIGGPFDTRLEARGAMEKRDARLRYAIAACALAVVFTSAWVVM